MLFRFLGLEKKSNFQHCEHVADEFVWNYAGFARNVASSTRVYAQNSGHPSSPIGLIPAFIAQSTLGVWIGEGGNPPL